MLMSSDGVEAAVSGQFIGNRDWVDGIAAPIKFEYGRIDVAVGRSVERGRLSQGLDGRGHGIARQEDGTEDRRLSFEVRWRYPRPIPEVMAPSTCGTFRRLCRFGHVRRWPKRRWAGRRRRGFDRAGRQ